MSFGSAWPTSLEQLIIQRTCRELTYPVFIKGRNETWWFSANPIGILKQLPRHDALSAWVSSLESAFGCLVGVNAYLTPAGAQGLRIGWLHWVIFERLHSLKLPRYNKNKNNNNQFFVFFLTCYLAVCVHLSLIYHSNVVHRFSKHRRATKQITEKRHSWIYSRWWFQVFFNVHLYLGKPPTSEFISSKQLSFCCHPSICLTGLAPHWDDVDVFVLQCLGGWWWSICSKKHGVIVLICWVPVRWEAKQGLNRVNLNKFNLMMWCFMKWL